MSPNTVTLNPNVTYQTMDGFGAAITGSTCYNLSLMTESNRKEFLKETFSPTEGLGFSYIRISIGCSDFSLSEYTCCDEKGIENFALTVEETKYIIPILKQIISINPSIKILGSPWTCPKWMKVNNLKDKQTYDSWVATYQSKVTLEQDLNFITEGLSAKGTVSFDATSGQYINRTMAANSYFATGRDSNGKLIYTLRNAGSALGNPTAASMNGEKKIYLETSLNYKRTFNRVHAQYSYQSAL